MHVVEASQTPLLLSQYQCFICHSISVYLTCVVVGNVAYSHTRMYFQTPGAFLV